MNENKLIKLLDLALSRIEELEEEIQTSDDYSDAMDKSSEELYQQVEELTKENATLQNYYEKTNKEYFEILEECGLLKSALEEKEAAIFDLNTKLEKLVDQNNDLERENEKLSNLNRTFKSERSLLEEKIKELSKNPASTIKPKWNDILDPTKRPRPNDQVLITTKNGKVIIGSFDEDGKVHNSGKPTQATAWMNLPRAFEN